MAVAPHRTHLRGRFWYATALLATLAMTAAAVLPGNAEGRCKASKQLAKMGTRGPIPQVPRPSWA